MRPGMHQYKGNSLCMPDGRQAWSHQCQLVYIGRDGQFGSPGGRGLGRHALQHQVQTAWVADGQGEAQDDHLYPSPLGLHLHRHFACTSNAVKDMHVGWNLAAARSVRIPTGDSAAQSQQT